MVVTIAKPPVPPATRNTPPGTPAGTTPRASSALFELWPPGVLPHDEAALLARPYKSGRAVPLEQSKCGTCIALCCRYIAFEVDGPTEPRDFELLRWFLLHEGTQLFVEGRTWFLQVFVRCRALGADYRCTIYDTRPEICRSYEADGCDRDEVERKATITRMFRSVEELEAWRVPWVKRWEAKRKRVRRLAAVKAARTRARRRAARRRAGGALGATRPRSGRT